MDEWRRIYFIVPRFNPVGGILRDLCFAAHARDLGYEVVVGSEHEAYDPSLPVFEIPHVRDLSPENGVAFVDANEISVGPRELAFFSGVGLYRLLERRLSQWTQDEQVIQAVRGPRPAEPSFAGGYGVKVLGLPLARMVTNEYVLEAVKPHLPPGSFTEIIPLGHDTTFFAKRREGGVGAPVKVAYTTWKSEVGDEAASLLEGDPAFEFRAIRGTARWEDLRELYHWADVFLSTPLPAEGFYLPGLEAMAAGNIVLTPDAFGNRAYCRFGENCVLVEHSDAQSYADTLRNLASADPETLDAMRRHGYETAARHTWEAEERRFAAFLERLVARLEKNGPPRRRRPADLELLESQLGQTRHELQEVRLQSKGLQRGLTNTKRRDADLQRDLANMKRRNTDLQCELDDIKTSRTFGVVRQLGEARARLPRFRAK